jgi:uncharacterized protein YaiE (UPF0345 family)
MAALGVTACGDTMGPDTDSGWNHTQVIEGEWRGQVTAGNTIEIKGIQGNIEAATASGQEIVVTWKKRGRHDDPAGVTVDVVQHAGGVTVCAVYPDIPGGFRNDCLPGENGHMATREFDVAVDFTVLVPAGVDFNGRTISGDVRVEDLSSNAFGSTISGNVDITTSELAEASTVSGSVNASIGRSDWRRNLAFSVMSGSVTVSIPENTNAEVWATAATGSVSSDFSLPRLMDGSLRGNIGAGGGMLRLSTVTGSISLKQNS